MSKSWQLNCTSCEEAKAALAAALETSQLPSSARLSWNGYDLEVTIEKAGRSNFTLSLEEGNGATVLKEAKKNVAFTHRPFVGRVEAFISELVTKANG